MNQPHTYFEEKGASTQQLSGKMKNLSAVPSILALRKIRNQNKVLHVHFIQLRPGLILLQGCPVVIL